MGIAPKVLSDRDQEAYSVSEFVEGHLMEHDEIVDKHNMDSEKIGNDAEPEGFTICRSHQGSSMGVLLCRVE